MVVRLVLWNLADSLTTVAELRDQLRDESPPAPGLLFEAWGSDETTERFGGFSVWDSHAAADQPPPSRVRRLIGKEPDIVELFDLDATVSVAEELAGLGLAFERES